MLILIVQQLSQTALRLLFVVPTPTLNNPWIGEVIETKPPTGWILAGFLILLLVAMVYQEIRKFIRKKILKKK